jgi:hypothetical protein
MDNGVRLLIEQREAREAALERDDKRQAIKRRRRSRLRRALALALIFAAYWLGYQCGFAAAMFH